MLGWMKHKLELRLRAEISITNPLQCSWLENPRDSGASWAAISGVAQSRTWLKWPSSNSSRYADDTTLMAESKEEPKSLLMKVKEESEKVGLKLNIQKTKIITSGPITSMMDMEAWCAVVHGGPITHGKQMGKQWKQWQTLFSWAPKSLQVVTAAMKLKDACSLNEKLWQI